MTTETTNRRQPTDGPADAVCPVCQADISGPGRAWFLPDPDGEVHGHVIGELRCEEHAGG